MAEVKTLKPADPATLVRKPGGQRLIFDGERIEITSYWIRRLAAGEVVEVETKAAKAAAEGKSK